MGAWHTPDAKIEKTLRDFIAQAGQDDLRGWNYMTRFSVDRKVYPQICVVCKQVADAHPDTVNPTGNWIADVEVYIKSIIKRTSGEAHDQAAGYVTDLLMRVGLIDQLNDVSQDSEIQFLRGRLQDRINDVDDANNRHETTIRWRTQVVPHRTQGQ